MPQERFSRKKKIPRIPTPESLANAALAYVEKYAASEASFRRVLLNKIRRAAMVHPSFAEDAAAQAALREVIETLVDKYRRLGALNDAAVAAMKAGSLRRGGASARKIAEKLYGKGIQQPLIAKALESAEIDGASEEEAARLFAKKKGLGPYRRARFRAIDEATLARREIASFLRAGFSFDLVKRVLGAEIDEDD